MKSKATLPKKDVVVILLCTIFLLMNIAAIGSGGRKRAKAMVCLSNLRQWGNIFQAYTNDNNGYFWHGPCTWEPGVGTTRWLNRLRPYYGDNNDLRLCPEATNFNKRNPFKALKWTAPSQRYVLHNDYWSYGINWWICDAEENEAGHSFCEGTLFSQHWWRTPYVAGADGIPAFLGAGYYGSWPENTDPPQATENANIWAGGIGVYNMNRHQGHVNGLFLDFSARKIGLKELWTLKWHRNEDTHGCPPIWPTWMQDFPEYYQPQPK